MSLFLSLLSFFVVTTSTTADYKVFVTKNRSEADLYVWESNSKYEALGKEEIWFQSESKYSSNVTIRFVKSKYQSNLIIYYVKNKSEAGWKKNHPLKNNLIQSK